MPISREVHLITRPNGMPQVSEFEIVETQVPDAADGQVLVQNLYMSVDPAMRPRLTSGQALNEATGNPFSAMVTGMALFAQAPPIYGGTDQVQRNIIGERVLGLPKEANNDKTAAFKDLPKNA